MLLGFVDTLMVGRFSKEALAAAVLANVWISGTSFFAMGVVLGMDPIITQAHGARDAERAGLCLQRGVVVALGVSLVLALSWVLTGPFLRLTGQSPELSAMAHRYVLVQIPSAVFLLLFTALRQYLQGRGVLWPALVVTLVANGLNVVFNRLLIFGGLGIPALGLEGAGISTALTRTLLFVGLLVIVRARRLHHGAWLPWSRRALERKGLAEVLRYGLPVGVQFSLEVWAFATATLMAGRLGTVAVAAHGIVLTMASLTFMVPMGVSHGAVTHIGNLLGEGAFARAQRASWVAFGLGAVAMSICALIFLLGRDALPLLFTTEPELRVLCATILPIAAAFQIFDGVQVVGAGILRGMGRTAPAAWFNLLAYWALSLPLAGWMAFELGMGLRGVWWGLALGLCIVALLMLFWNRLRGPASLDPGRDPGAHVS